MMEMEKNHDDKVSVAHYRRGLPLFNKIKQLVNDGAIGKVKLILLRTLQPTVSKIISQTGDNWRINPEISGGGLFHDLSPHQLDIMYWIFGEPQQTYVQSANQGKLYNAPDLTMVQLAFANDIYFNGIWNFNVAETATSDSCEIIGDKGTIRFSFFRVSTIELVTGTGTEIFELEYPVNIQQPHINNVVRFFRGEGSNPCSLEEALVTMKVMDKAN
jgi:predicted dehydrogenase